jgi:hypothetical protein
MTEEAQILVLIFSTVIVTFGQNMGWAIFSKKLICHPGLPDSLFLNSKSQFG